jgi:glycosyl transferase family 25
MINSIDKVYVLHVKIGYEDRALHMEKLLKKHAIEFEYILDHDISDLKEENLAKYYAKNHTLDNPNKSVGMKHIQILELIVENEFKNTLVFEDDVFLNDNFSEIVLKAMKELKEHKGGYAISLGNAANHYTKKNLIVPGKLLYKNIKHRASDSYIINFEAAKNRLEWFKKNRTVLPAGHMYNQIDIEVNNTIYWMEPPIVEQGSQNGLMNSSIQTKKTFQRLRWLLRDFNKKYLNR